jgi:pimeloyl-ACP methyl ester carboxylesterase
MIYAVFLLITFAILFFVFYQWQHFAIFSPTYYREEKLDESFELLSIKTDEGIELEGIMYKPKDFRATLLFFGGRSHDTVGLIKKLSQTFPHAAIITFNYRSYGKSGGVVSEKNILNDGLKIAQIVQKNYGDFYVLGFSLGSCVASYVGKKQKVLGVFLVGCFDSFANLAKQKHGINPLWLLRYKCDNTKLVEHIDAKTYIFVSKSDEITYVQNARNLKRYVKNLVHYEELDNLSHKELLWSDDVAKVINKVLLQG